MASPTPLKAPGPRGHFLLGNLREFRADVLGLVMRSTANYGDIVRCRLGPQVVHLLNHPTPIAHVLQRHAANYDKATRSSASIRAVTGESLLTCNGDLWKRQRRMDQPAFHHRHIAGFVKTMTDAAQTMLDGWRAHNEATAPVNLASEMARLTYSIVGRTLFSFNTTDDAATIERAMRVMLPLLFKRLGQVAPPPLWFPTRANRDFNRALSEVDQVVYRIIASHRQAAKMDAPPNDLLGLLMQAREPERGVALSDAQLRNETITFLLAGHETTANALTWCFHLIAQHPEVERQLVEEIATVLGQRTPVMEDLGKLVYTRRVIQESMRLYPPIWIIERRAIDADCVEGFQIPKGSSVVISPYALHRHPAYWEDPERFDPSRFEQHPPAAYLPFGAGPRTCIGNEFAMMEALIITAMVMQSFHLQAEPGQRIEPQPDITLRPKHGVMMTYHPREGR